MKHITILFILVFMLPALPLFTQRTAGYIISGQSKSYTHGDWDFLVYRIDAQGKKVWRKNYGGAGEERGGSLTEMHNNSFALAGSSENSFETTKMNCIVYLLTGAGKILWRRIFGPVHNSDNTAVSINSTSEGGYVVCGSSNLFLTLENNNGLVAKLDGNGNTIWWHIIPNTAEPANEEYSSIQQTADGGYIANVHIFTGYSFGIDKLDENGYRIWHKRMGGSVWDSSLIVRQTADGGYVVGGGTTSFTHGSYDYLVFKLNGSGQKQWRKNYGGQNVDKFTDLDITSDGGYILFGHSYSYSNGFTDMLVYKIDAAGQKQWRKNFGGGDYEIACAINQTSDGGYTLIGNTDTYSNGSTDILVYKLAADGKKQWRKNYGGSYLDHGTDIIEITQ